MEEEAVSRRSVAELAGKFTASPHNAAGTGSEVEKPVRRRPPRTLPLPTTQGEQQEQAPGVTSPLPSKAKRNSALIEKLQASLVLPGSSPIPSPKSPGFRLLPPTLTPASPGSAPETVVTSSCAVTPTSPVTASPATEEEGPTSFEAPPTVTEGSILPSMNKSRARHSIRRRPPSRRHRKSSSGDEVGVTNDVTDKTTGGEGGGDVFKKDGQTDDLKDDKTEASTSPGEDQQHETESREEEEEGKEEGEEENRSLSGGKEEKGQKEEEKEEKEESEEKEKQSGEGVTEKVTNTESSGEEKSSVIPT